MKNRVAHPDCRFTSETVTGCQLDHCDHGTSTPYLLIPRLVVTGVLSYPSSQAIHY